MKFVWVVLSMMGAAGGLAAQEPDIGTPPGRMVDIGGRKLHLHCTGTGSPTVILEAGASSFALDWTLVQEEVARSNRVCSYDRAGFGWSDPSRSATRSTVSEDLHTLLRIAGEAPPYVMVGASLGGIYVRLYQADHPDQVVGMVLVDPATEGRLYTMLQGEAVLIASLTAEQLRRTIRPGTFAVPRRPPQTGAPFNLLPPDLYTLRINLDTRLIATMQGSMSYEARVESAEAERARLARLRALSGSQGRPLGNRPLVVLSRGMESSQGQLESHAGLAVLSTNSRHSVVTDAGHEIHLFQPKAVIRAIADVVESSRTGKRLSPP